MTRTTKLIKVQVTNRMLHEYIAGMGLEDLFFKLHKIDADKIVECNCGTRTIHHDPNCNICIANLISMQLPKYEFSEPQPKVKP